MSGEGESVNTGNGASVSLFTFNSFRCHPCVPSSYYSSMLMLCCGGLGDVAGAALGGQPGGLETYVFQAFACIL